MLPRTRNYNLLKDKYNMTDNEISAIKDEYGLGWNFRDVDENRLKDLERDNASDMKMRLTGLGIGALAGGGLSSFVPYFMHTPAMARYAPIAAGAALGALASKGVMHLRRKRHDNYNSALDKLHGQLPSEPAEVGSGAKDAMAIGGTIGAATGAELLSDAYHSGDLTGRMTLHHGTNPANRASILEHGLMGTTPTNSVNTIALKKDTKNPQRFLESLNKVYLSKTKDPAYMYAAQGAMGGVEKAVGNPAGMMLEKALAPFKGGVITFNVPKYKYTQVTNPEIGHNGFEGYKKMMDANKDPFLRGNDFGEAHMYNMLNDAVVLDTNNLSAEFAKGSRHYVGNSPKEFISYVRSHPRDFLRGVGKAGAGAAALAGSAYLLHKALKNRDQDQPKQQAQ